MGHFPKCVMRYAFVIFPFMVVLYSHFSWARVQLESQDRLSRLITQRTRLNSRGLSRLPFLGVIASRNRNSYRSEGID